MGRADDRARAVPRAGYRRLMEAHVAAGNRAEALQVYERCRRLLADELGTYPSPETESDLPQPARSTARPTPKHRPLARRRTRLRPPAMSEARGSPGRRRVALLLAAVLVAGVVAAALAISESRRQRHRRGSAEQCRPDRSTHAEGDTGRAGHRCPRSGRRSRAASSGSRATSSATSARAHSETQETGPSHGSTHRAGKAVIVGGGLAPCGLTADPSGDIWVANCYPGTSGPRDDVVRIDAQTLHFKKTFPIPGGYGFLRGLTYGGGSVWVTEIFGGDVRTRAA